MLYSNHVVILWGLDKLLSDPEVIWCSRITGKKAADLAKFSWETHFFFTIYFSSGSQGSWTYPSMHRGEGRGKI